VNWLSGHLLDPAQLLEGNIFHPVRHAVLLSDLAFGTALLVAPLRALALVKDPVPLYNVGVLLTLAFGAWAFYRLARSLTGSTAAGLLTGILAAYGSHQLLHVYQLALVNVAFLALFLLGLHRLIERPRPATAVLAGVGFALTALSSAYFAVAGAVLSLVFAAVEWRRLRRRDVLTACAVAAVVAALLLLPYVLSFASLQAREGVERPVQLSVDESFQPGRDLTSGTYLYRRWRGSRGERLFPGVACLALAAVACVRRPKGWVFYAAGALVLLVVSLGPQLTIGDATLPLPYAALFAHRPFNALMHPYTFAAVARLALCVLAGLGLASLLRRPVPWASPLAVLIGFVEVAEPPLATRPVALGVPAVYHALDALPPGPILELPPQSTDALIGAARHGRLMVNGTGGLEPPQHARLNRWIERDWLAPALRGHSVDVDRTRAMRQVLRMPVEYVVIPVDREPGLRPIQESFDRSRLFVRVAGVTGSSTAYRRVPVDASEP
jgi:hypothetical protein